MIQWFRGRLEAAYVGTPIVPAGALKPGAEHFKPRLYRAIVRNVELIDPPAGCDAQPAPAPSRKLWYEPRVDTALVPGIRGPGSSFEGPLFDLRIDQIQWSHRTRQGARSYGIVTGSVIAYCELPPEPRKPELETRIVEEDADIPAQPLVGELRYVTETQHTSASADEAAQLSSPDLAKPEPEAEMALALPPARVKLEREDSSAAPLFALSAATALGLWASCGAAPALLWIVFMLPTLIARKLFYGVLRDSNGIRGFGLALIIVQLFCVSTLLSAWWSADCRQLQLLPLLGIVAVIFPAGLLPSALPLSFNAAGLALVLSVWCGGGKDCPDQLPKRMLPARPSVEHPGVPRTNDDGSWPRRPPG